MGKVVTFFLLKSFANIVTPFDVTLYTKNFYMSRDNSKKKKKIISSLVGKKKNLLGQPYKSFVGTYTRCIINCNCSSIFINMRYLKNSKMLPDITMYAFRILLDIL